MNTIVFDIETRPEREALDRIIKPFDKQAPAFPLLVKKDIKLGNVIRDAKIRTACEACLVPEKPTKKKPADPKVCGIMIDMTKLEKIEGLEAASQEKFVDAIVALREKAHAAYAEKLEKHNQEETDYYAKAWDKAALSPAFSSIQAIGWQVPGCPPVCMIVGDNIEDEATLLKVWIEFVMGILEETDSSARFQFWDASMNIHENFDLSHIEKAIIRHKAAGTTIPLPAHFWALPGQRGAIFENLRMVFGRHGGFFANSGYPDYLGLDTAVQVYGGHGQVADEVMKGDDLVVMPKADMESDGASFWKWCDAGEYETARAYLENDLAQTRFLSNLHPFRGGGLSD